MDVDDPRQSESVWDSEIATIFESQSFLAPQVIDLTVDPVGSVHSPFVFKGQVYFVSPAGVAYQFTGPNTLGSYSNVIATPDSVLDVKPRGSCGSMGSLQTPLEVHRI
jgi:hypothetical protein